MKENQDFPTWEKDLEAVRRQWETKYNRHEGALLQGGPLAEAQRWLQKHPEEIKPAERIFIEQSLALRDKEKEEKQHQWVRTIKALCAYSEQLFARGQELDALMEMIRVGKELKQKQQLENVRGDTQMLVAVVLRKILYEMRERNRLGHSHNLTIVVLSPDGQTLAAASSDRTIKVWKLDGTQLATLKVSRPDIDSLVFSPDSQTLAASTSHDKKIELWRIDGSKLATINNSTAVQRVCFSPNNQMLVSANHDKTIKLWKLDGTLLATFKGHSNGISSLVFSPDGQILASASYDKTIKLWQIGLSLLTLESIELATLTGHKREVTGVLFSPDGQTLASESADCTIKIWNLDGTELATLTGREREYSRTIVFSPDGQRLFSTSRHEPLKVWNLDRKKYATNTQHCFGPYRLLKQKTGDWHINFSRDKDNESLILACHEGKNIGLWNQDAPKSLKLKAHSKEPTSIAFSPDGQLLASASKDKTIKLWNLEGSLLATFTGHNDRIWHVSFSPNGQILASASYDGTIKLWNRSGTELTTLTGHSGSVNRVVFSPDGQMLVSASDDGSIKLWQVNLSLLALDSIELNTFTAHSDGFSSLVFSPDGQTLLTGSPQGIIKLWKLDGTELKTFRGHSDAITSLVFNPVKGSDRSKQAPAFCSASRDKTIKLWTLDGTELSTFKEHEKAISSIAFHPDGYTLASSSARGLVKLFQLDGTEIASFDGCSCCCDGITISVVNHDGTVEPHFTGNRENKLYCTSVAFSPDGKLLANTLSCGKIHLWNLDFDDLLVRGCDWLRSYVKNNPNVSESDRHLCDGI